MNSKKVERLDKFLASQLNISRKDAHRLIREQMITVDEDIATKSDQKIDPSSNSVKFDGKTVKYRKYIYIMMNKPEGFVSASDGKGEPTVIDLLPPDLKRKKLFPAGRLDKNTTGFLLITDDGEFAHRLLSPKNNITKTYEAAIDIKITDDHINLFNKGITLADGTKLKSAQLTPLAPLKDGQLVQIVISEGKFHQIKRMINHIGGNVLMLKRTKIGSVSLDKKLKLGQSREMLHKELDDIL